jgi:hypothetical protein
MSHPDELEHIVREIRQRVTRIESRICRIGDGLDISLRSPKNGLKVLSIAEDVVEVHTECMDIAISELISFAERSGFSNLEVDVFHEGYLITTIIPKANRSTHGSAR